MAGLLAFWDDLDNDSGIPMECPVCHTENAGSALQCSSCSSSLNFGSENRPPSPDSFDSPTFAPSPAWRGSGSRPPGGSSVAVAAANPDFGPRYRLERKLGEGGMGSVYKAYDLELDRTVALKVIRPDLMANAEVLQRFKQELLLASRISHKNVLRIHDLGVSADVKFISMAYVEGRNLAEVLHDQKVFPVDKAVEIAKQICQALAAAHREGVVHRDLKPQNILIDRGQCVYVSDFGLAKSLECDAVGATAMTSVGQVLGTPRYMSPEQVECSEIDGRTDIYSFGLMLYEMVTGDVPFQGNSLQLMLGRVQSMPRNPSMLNSKLPAYLVGIIMRCLEKDRQRRYQGFEDVLHDLNAQRFTPPGRSPAKSIFYAWYIAVAAALLLLIAAVSVPGVRRHISVLTGARIQFGKSTPQMEGKHLAVVPLSVVGNDAKLNEAAVGIVDALNSRLFQVKDMTILSSTATANSKPTDKPEKLSHDLGANLLVLGSIQGVGDKIRVDLSLWDAGRNNVTWSSEVSGVFGDLLTLEDDIGKQVLKALSIGADTSAPLASHPTENMQAYDLYLRGQTMMRDQKDAQHVQSALDLYNQAIQIDPNFALAFAGLADADAAMYAKKKDPIWANKALEDARHAADLNSQLPEVHLSLGNAYSVIGRNSEAIGELQQAVELLPNSDQALRDLGKAQAKAGNVKEAIESYKKAIQINPYYWMNYNQLGSAYYSSGDYENAAAAFKKVVEIEPDNGFGYGNLGGALLLLGKFQEAVPPLQKALQIAPTGARYSNLGIAYYYLSQYDLAIPLFEKAVQAAPASWMYVGNLADGYRLAGKKDLATKIYDQAIDLGKKDLAVNSRNAMTMGVLGLWYAKKGDVTEGRRLIDAARAIDPTTADLIYFQAQIAALGGDHAAAVSALQSAFEKGLKPAIAVAEPDLKSLANDSAFSALVRRFSKS